MIRLTFTPSTIGYSLDSLFREKPSGGPNGNRGDYNYVKIGIVAAIVLAVLFAASLLSKNYYRNHSGRKWQSSAAREAGTRRTLMIGGARYGFVWIPAGEFEMGSPKSERDEATVFSRKYGSDRNFSEEEQQHVKIPTGFWMLETETTQGLYKKIMKTNPSRFRGARRPVETVSWEDATKFCQELTKRLPKGLRATLPTEAQWEYACRAGTTTPYSFGTALNGDKANCNGNYPFGTWKKGKNREETTPVKDYRKNPWGLYDMHGNVWEWTQDRVLDSIDDEADEADRAVSHMIRGGGWKGGAGLCRSARRQAGWSGPDDDLGFRFLLIYD